MSGQIWDKKSQINYNLEWMEYLKEKEVDDETMSD
jgi:hypothetical protein